MEYNKTLQSTNPTPATVQQLDPIPTPGLEPYTQLQWAQLAPPAPVVALPTPDLMLQPADATDPKPTPTTDSSSDTITHSTTVHFAQLTTPDQQALNKINAPPQLWSQRHYPELETMDTICHKELYEREQLALQSGYFTKFALERNVLTAAGLAARLFYYQTTHPDLTQKIQCIFEFTDGFSSNTTLEETLQRKIEQARLNTDRVTFIIYGDAHSVVLCYQPIHNNEDLIFLLDSTKTYRGKIAHLMNHISPGKWNGYMNRDKYQHTGSGCRLLALHTALEIERYFQANPQLTVQDLANDGSQRKRAANLKPDKTQFTETDLPTCILPMTEQYSLLAAEGLGSNSTWESQEVKPGVTYATKLRRHAVTTRNSRHSSPYLYNNFSLDKESNANDFITKAILHGALPIPPPTYTSMHLLDSTSDQDREWEQQVIYLLGMQDGLPENILQQPPTDAECTRVQQQLTQYIQTAYPHPHQHSTSHFLASPYYVKNLQYAKQIALIQSKLIQTPEPQNPSRIPQVYNSYTSAPSYNHVVYKKPQFYNQAQGWFTTNSSYNSPQYLNHSMPTPSSYDSGSYSNTFPAQFTSHPAANYCNKATISSINSTYYLKKSAT